jgi:hypothetical protein
LNSRTLGLALARQAPYDVSHSTGQHSNHFEEEKKNHASQSEVFTVQDFALLTMVDIAFLLFYLKNKKFL